MQALRTIFRTGSLSKKFARTNAMSSSAAPSTFASSPLSSSAASSSASSSSSSSSAAAAMSTSSPSDFSDLFTPTTRRRETSPIRALIRYANVPGMISLGGGMPHPKTFPFSRLTLETKSGKTLALEGSDLLGALQYSQTEGHPALRKCLFDLQNREHGVVVTGPDRTHDVTVTTGSQDGLTRVLEMLLTPQDTVLLDEAAYSGALSFLQPLGCTLAPIKNDSGGIIPESLEEVLDNWPEDGSQGKRPRVLYLVPCGGNPTGTSLSEERKQKIYEIASRPENNLVLLEDDPYYYIQFNDPASGVVRIPSFLSMDTDQRVVRFDSFSKVLSAGIRVGFCTAPPAISERLQLHLQSTILHSCALSQAVVASLLNDWGYDRFIEHTLEVTEFYRSQRDAFVEAAERHLKPLGEGKVTWTIPTAGMFVWINLAGLGITDTEKVIVEDAAAAKVLFVPGNAFTPDQSASTFVRAAFSMATPEEMDTGMERFAAILRERYL